MDIDRFDEIISLSQELGLNPLPQDPLNFASETMVLPTQEKTTGIRVDFIFSFTPYESQAIRRARQIFLNHQAVCFASPEVVVIHKIVAGRPRDLEDIRTILIKNPQIDTEYIRNWLKQLSATLEDADLTTIFFDMFKELSEGESK